MSVDTGARGDARWAANEPQKATEVETFGIDTIPAEDRTAKPLDLFRVEFGGANTFATVVLGALTVLVFGLGFWDAMLAMLLGVVVGGLILMPMALFGPITGTNNAVSSGAHFGVVGRIVGSFLALLVAITFFAISIYTSGDILVGALDKLFGTGRSDALVAVAYAFFAFAILAVCIYGFRFMLAVNKVAVITATLLYVVGAIAYGGDLKTGYAGFAKGDAFFASFVGAALIALSNPLSFGAYLGDWTRYIPASASRGRLMAASFFAQLATVVPYAFGIATATVIATNAPGAAKVADYAGGLIDVTPDWFLVPVAIIAIIGGLSTGTTSLYGTGLDMSSVFPRLTRVQSTILIGLISIAIVFIGRFALDFVDTIVTFATLIIVCTVPWVIIMTIGFIVRRGHYLPDDLQVFNRGQRGGAYWFTRGVNWRGMTAWIPSAIVALCFVNLPGQFEGPLRNTAEDIGFQKLAGVDLSLIVAIFLPAILYVVFLALFPEPRGVFGPDGPRGFRAKEDSTEEIQPRESAPALR
jgi:purine-cytosine permease-like protein